MIAQAPRSAWRRGRSMLVVLLGLGCGAPPAQQEPVKLSPEAGPKIEPKARAKARPAATLPDKPDPEPEVRHPNQLPGREDLPITAAETAIETD